MQLSILSDSVKSGHAAHFSASESAQCERTLTHLVSLCQLIVSFGTKTDCLLKTKFQNISAVP